MTIKAENCIIYNGDTPFRGRVNIILDDAFIIKGVKVIAGKKGLFVSMPSYFNRNWGVYLDVCHPKNRETRAAIQDAALAAYTDKVARMEEEGSI